MMEWVRIGQFFDHLLPGYVCRIEQFTEVVLELLANRGSATVLEMRF
jgi:hypothetical protein